MVNSTGRTIGWGRVSSELIARDEAIDLAIRRWEQAESVGGGLLLVAGESGIGKTRLLEELIVRTGEKSSPKAGAFPRETQAPGAILLNLADDLRRRGFEHFGGQLRDRISGEQEGWGDVARRLLLNDLAAILIDLVASGRVLVRLEDLHWADEFSLDVLERVASALPSVSSLVVATYRSDDIVGRPLHAWRARLLTQRLAEEVRLVRLDRDETGRLAEAITGIIPSTDLLDALYRNSDGIPLHIEELVATGTESAVLESVAEAVSVQLAQLDSSTREVIAAASVIGRAFDVGLLAQIASVSQSEVQDALGQASNLSLVRQHRASGGYGFRHSIVCDVVYSTIPPDERAALHGAVARAADAAGMGEAYVSEHFERAGETILAHSHALVAARDAMRMSAHREAASLYRRAESTLPPTTSDSALADLLCRSAKEHAIIGDNAAAAVAFAHAIDLYRGLGQEGLAAALIPQLMGARYLLGTPFQERAGLALQALSNLGENTGSQSLHARAGLLGALSTATMLDRQLEASLGFGARASKLVSGAERVDIDLTIGSVLVYAGRGEEGWKMLESAVRTAEDAGFEEAASRGYCMIGGVASTVMKYSLARSWITEGLQYCARTEHWDDHSYLLAHSAYAHWATGNFTEGKRVAERALADAHGVTTRAAALAVLGYIALAGGRVEDARVHLTDSLQLGEGLNEVQSISPALWGLAELAMYLGDPARAIALCERGFSESNRVKDSAQFFPFVVTGTRAKLATRDNEAAHDWLQRCSELLGIHEIPGSLTALDHARGLIELALGHTGKARISLEAANSSWLELDRFWEGTQALSDLARCANRSRRPREAAQYNVQAHDRAIAAGAVGLVAGQLETGKVDVGPLSARELDVAGLVALGLTNRQIAESLTIAPKTVSSHVEHILAKLGASRRAEIASWVTRAAPPTL